MNKKVTTQIDIQLNTLSRISQGQILDNFRLSFLHLSGLEVNQEIYERIEHFSLFIREQTKLMAKLKATVEQALVTKIAMNTRLVKLYRQMNQLEGLLAESFSSTMEDEAPIEFMYKSQHHACERFADIVMSNSK